MTHMIQLSQAFKTGFFKCKDRLARNHPYLMLLLCCTGIPLLMLLCIWGITSAVMLPLSYIFNWG